MIHENASEMSRGGADARAVVDCHGLTKVFRDFWMRPRARALDAVSFEIRKGEIFGLLGPNGSGKSTTIKIILGLLHKTRGRVSVFGKLPTDVSIKRRIGYLPEESYMYAFLNARETLDYYGKLFELDRSVRKRRIDELLDMVGLNAVQFRPVNEYSKGMQRRIGIAQALINDPELLILDEPTTGLDPIGTRQVKDLILELGRRGKTVLLSSHLLADVEDCVDRMVILYGGRIQREGTCDQLLEARERSLIEIDALDDDTINRIDELIRARTGGESGILRVSKPRQRLEELFIDMVEQARRAKLENSGAQHGGETASFLRGEESAGEALIEELMRDKPADETRTPEDPTDQQTPEPEGPDENVLDSLLDEPREESDRHPAEPEHESSPTAPPESPERDVDHGVIGSLMDTAGEDDRDKYDERERERDR